MKMPGFNADAALRGGGNHYQTTGTFALGNNGIVPQFEFDFEWHPIVLCIDGFGCSPVLPMPGLKLLPYAIFPDPVR
jgi:hypothetical protein